MTSLVLIYGKQNCIFELGLKFELSLGLGLGATLKNAKTTALGGIVQVDTDSVMLRQNHFLKLSLTVII